MELETISIAAKFIPCVQNHNARVAGSRSKYNDPSLAGKNNRRGPSCRIKERSPSSLVQMKQIVDDFNRSLRILLAHDGTDANLGCRDHLDVDTSPAERGEHLRRYVRPIHQPGADYADFGDIFIHADALRAQLLRGGLERFKSGLRIITSDGKRDVVDRSIFVESLNYHIDAYAPLRERPKNQASHSGLIRCLEDGKTGLVAV